MSRIFISHSSSNMASAIALRDWLDSNGWAADETFLDVDDVGGIAGGERWEEELTRAATRCEAVFLLLSPAWLSSSECRAEYTFSRYSGKKLFPVIVDEVRKADLPSGLQALQILDLAGAGEKVSLQVNVPRSADPAMVTFNAHALRQLRSGLERAGIGARSFRFDPSRPIFRGLAAFEKEDAAIYFGREAKVADAVERLRLLATTGRAGLLVILGASGAGKSSFLRAGVLPRLEREDRTWLVLPIIRPGSAAISGKEGLIESLRAAAAQCSIRLSRDDVGKVVSSTQSLRSLLQELREATWRRIGSSEAELPSVILPIDQCEELFDASSGEALQEAQHFIRLMTSLVQEGRLKLVLTVRSDRYSALQLSSLADLTAELFPLPPMPKGAYKEIIEGPIRRLRSAKGLHAVTVDAILIDVLLQETGGEGPDALPLLAFVLERLYLKYDALTIDGFRLSNGLQGAISAAVGDAVAPLLLSSELADGAEQRALLRPLFPMLARVDVGSSEVRRRVARLDEFSDQQRLLVERLVSARILVKQVLSDDAGVPFASSVSVELTHEALFRHWPDLASWLVEERATLVQLDHVLRGSSEWVANGKNDDWLLSSGRLLDAESLSKRNDYEARFTKNVHDYIQASRDREDAAAAKKRQDLDARQKLIEEREKTQTVAFYSLIVAALLVVTGAVGLYSWWDSFRIKTRYFANYEMKWGAPVGIGELGAGDAARREVSFLIATQNGAVVSMRRQNGSGGLVPIDSDDLYFKSRDWDVAEWRLPYPKERAVEVDLYNETGKRIRVERFTFLDDRSAIVSLSGGVGAITDPAANSGSYTSGLLKRNSSRSRIAQYLIEFDAAGRVRKRLFQTVWGQPVSDSDGSFGEEYSYSSDGRSMEIVRLDNHGKAFVERSGIAAVVHTYDLNHNLIRVDWRDKNGAGVSNEYDFSSVVIVRDRAGNEIEKRYLDPHNSLVLRSDYGYARSVVKFDALGNLLEVQYFGVDGRPIRREDRRIAIWRWEVDKFGRDTATTYFDTMGRRTLSSFDGAFRQTWKYDERGNELETEYFGVNDEPVSEVDYGYFRKLSSYDQHGNVLTESYFGTDGKPIESKYSGCARAAWKYNSQGSTVEDSFFGVDGKPCLHKTTGVFRTTWKLDERDRQIEEHYFGVDGRATLSKEKGVAGARWRYDEANNLLSEEYLGLDGELTARSDQGFARASMEYDVSGNETAQRYFDEKNAAVNRKDWGVAALKRVLNDGAFEESYFDANGKPVIDKTVGAARVVQQRDHRENPLESALFGVTGKLRMHQGYAKIVRTYDPLGHRLSTTYFDDHDRPASYEKIGVFQVLETHDYEGLLTSETLLDRFGKPATRRDLGTSRRTITYDEFGRMISERHLGIDNKLSARKDQGVAVVRFEYDKRGNLIAENYFDEGDRPVIRKDLGAARVTYKYDGRGSRTELGYFDQNLKPVLSVQRGCAKIVERRDGRGNFVEEFCFGIDGQPALRSDWGAARVSTKFDDRDNQIEETYFGRNNEPVLRRDEKAAKIVTVYDAKDRKLEDRYFDVQGNLTRVRKN